MAHGAAMSNMLFCKSGCTIIEVLGNHPGWQFFDTISTNLKLNHIKITKHSINTILHCVKKLEI